MPRKIGEYGITFNGLTQVTALFGYLDKVAIQFYLCLKRGRIGPWGINKFY